MRSVLLASFSTTLILHGCGGDGPEDPTSNGQIVSTTEEHDAPATTLASTTKLASSTQGTTLASTTSEASVTTSAKTTPSTATSTTEVSTSSTTYTTMSVTPVSTETTTPEPTPFCCWYPLPSSNTPAAEICSSCASKDLNQPESSCQSPKGTWCSGRPTPVSTTTTTTNVDEKPFCCWFPNRGAGNKADICEWCQSKDYNMNIDYCEPAGTACRPNMRPALPAVCEPMMKGVDCLGWDHITTSLTETPEECCALCGSNPLCGAWTHKAWSRTCDLKRKCTSLVTDYSNSGLHSGVPAGQREHIPEPTCSTPELGRNYNCDGDDIEVHKVKNEGDCCDLCKQNPECLLYTFSKDRHYCHLRKECRVKYHNDNYNVGWAPDRSAAPRFQVGRGHYELDGYQCGQGGSTVIFYPKGDGPFRVVVYGHGAWGAIDGCDSWLESVASLGLIVIAPFQDGDGATPCHSKFADDLLNALHGSRTGGAQLHPVLAKADWTKTGIFGHSKGAKYAPLAAHKGRRSHNVSALVLSCDVPAHFHNVKLPTMVTAGTLDTMSNFQEMQDWWHQIPSKNKVFANLEAAYHMEVQEGMRMNLLTGRFLSCEVTGNHDDCDAIYGSGADSICQVNNYHDCLVTGGRRRRRQTPNPKSDELSPGITVV